MHPILQSRSRLGIYLAAWIPIGTLLAALVRLLGRREWSEAFALAMPLALVYAFVCLSAWFVCRSAPLNRTKAPRIVLSIFVSSAASSALWVLIGKGWASALSGPLGFPRADERFVLDMPLFLAVGVLLFLLAIAVHYLMIAFEVSREAERRALELQVLARDAQLKVLKAQIDPHFLFNSLNSISALAGSDPQGARRMCLLLAGFLRSSIKLGTKEEITLTEELSLAEGFLAIEQVRFGSRLEIAWDIDETARPCLVPPLLLQPLVENAVGHGIASLVPGGTVRIAAHREGGRLRIEVANPRDPDKRTGGGEGVGLANVKARLAAVFSGAARVELEDLPVSYRVVLTLPARGGSTMDEAPARSAEASSKGTAIQGSLLAPSESEQSGGPRDGKPSQGARDGGATPGPRDIESSQGPLNGEAAPYPRR